MERPITRKDALKLGAAASVAAAGTGLLPREAAAEPVRMGSRPSILLIVVDDMPDRLLSVMGKVRSKLVDKGTRFLNANTAIPLCGPNRAAMLSGRFPHTTDVYTNSAWKPFSSGGNEKYTFVKALDDNGYDTALFGKYMNGRGGSLSIPPGWDRWFELPGSSTHKADGYSVNDQGRKVDYPESKNDSQLSYEKALDWVKSRGQNSGPFFIQWSPTAPHYPYAPTAAHAHDYDGHPPRDAPSINEADMSDKPSTIRGKGKLDASKLSNYEEGMREELADVDDWAASLINAVEDVTGNSNLLIIFTSDNGIQVGEHRVMNKSWPYQESIEIPLIMRGTRLPAQASTQLASTVDIASTILKFAGVSPPRSYDGRSLHRIVEGGRASSWRKRVLIENPRDKNWQMYREFQPSNSKDFAYIENLNSTPEFYNLAADEYQLDSRPGRITNDMRSKLDRLTRRSGGQLRAVEEEA